MVRLRKHNTQASELQASTCTVLMMLCSFNCRGMILVSEIGDKTFFIAAIMAMKNKRSTVRIPHE